MQCVSCSSTLLSPWGSRPHAATRVHSLNSHLRRRLVHAHKPASAGRHTTSTADIVRDFDGNYGTGSKTQLPEPPADLLNELRPEEQATVILFQQNSPSVVNIQTTSTMLSLFPLPNIMKLPRGVGSGFVWDRDGHVVTNAHVVNNAQEVKVTLFDQSVFPAKVIGSDREKDLAVLQLDMPRATMQSLRPVVLGSSSTLLVGQKVFAIGNPFGLDQTLTSGIVSGLGRELPVSPPGIPITNVIQTDAAINPGNSGGVLLDSRGRLVGINTAILDPTGTGVSSGVGFAIPIDSAKGLVQQILTHGRVLRPSLGISLGSPNVLQQRGQEGVLVYRVLPRGPAAQSGMVGTSQDFLGNMILGDVIVGMKGQKVRTESDLFSVLDECRVGEVVEVVVRRGDYTRVLNVQLADRYANNRWGRSE